MTDNEIIKALECCRDNGTSNTYCDDCAYSVYEDCGARQAKDTLDLINRLKAQNKEFDEKIVIQRGAIDWQANEINRQKAEIERLQKECICLEEQRNAYKDIVDTCETGAIKEFAERLKEKATSTFYEEHKYVDTEDIDNLVKEMTDEQ